jgi:Lrp/AsnC family transcriptional regulator for asnA, asnC and gidA
MVRISDLDLLEALRENSRTPFMELARRFGVTETAVRKRVRKLEERGVIKKYTIDVDMRKMGYELKATIGLDTTPERYMSTIEKLKRMKNVMYLCSCSGDHMIMINRWFRNSDELSAFVKSLETMEGVTRVCPAVVTQEVK